MPKEKYDFSGWATKNDLRCADGVTIRRDAFKDQDGKIVPLVWQHQHNSPENVLGHGVLHNYPEGVRIDGVFNKSEMGQYAKELVESGDVTQLSIYANQLKKQGNNVMHGVIREVSLVLAGANPGATIDFPILQHSDGSMETLDEEAIIYPDLGVELWHADEKEDTEETGKEEKMPNKGDKTVKEVFDSLDDEQKQVLYYLVGLASQGKLDDKSNTPISHAADDEDDENKDEDGLNVKEVFATFDEDQKKLAYFLVGKAIEDREKRKGSDEDDESDEYEDEGEEEEMKHNVFENETSEDTLQHDAMALQADVISDWKRYGSMKDAFLAHAGEYGIDNIDYLFPDAKNVTTEPDWIRRPDTWVTKVMGGVHHVPFSRIKSMHADITADEARARGYLKTKAKKEEVFTLLKRVTTPQTVYKKQKLDRDDIIDITDFDVVGWMKTEMRWMLDEELARAFLFGDGRLSSSDDKIQETNIRPIITDADLYTIKVGITAGADDAATAKNMIRAAIKARKDYRGSGNPTLFIGENWLSEMLLLEDTLGHSLYKTEAELATKMRVKEIVAVPDELIPNGYYFVIVNLNDYYVGADKGGSVNMFDDFDIDVNQMKYLIETRCSGALVKPFSAIVGGTAPMTKNSEHGVMPKDWGETEDEVPGDDDND